MSSVPALSSWTSRMLKRTSSSSTPPPPPPPPPPLHDRWIKAFASTVQGQVDREEIAELRIRVSELEGERNSLHEKLYEALAREAARATSTPHATEGEAARRLAESAAASYGPPSWSNVAEDMAALGISLQWDGVPRGDGMLAADGEGYSWYLRGEGGNQAAALGELLSAAPGLWSHLHAAAVDARRVKAAAEARQRAAEEEAAAEQERVRLAEEKRLGEEAKKAEIARAKAMVAEEQERLRLEVKAAAEKKRRAAEEEAAAEQERVRLAEEKRRRAAEDAAAAEQERVRLAEEKRHAKESGAATRQAAAARKRPAVEAGSADSNPSTKQLKKSHLPHESGGTTVGSSGIITHKGAAVFVCDQNTMPEVIRRRLFGASASMLHMYEKAVEQGMPLFLRNYTTGQILGPFEAVSQVQKNIDRQAWGGRYSTQVRVNWGAIGAQRQALRAVPVTSLAAFRGAHRKKLLLNQKDTEELMSALEQRGTVLVFATM